MTRRAIKKALKRAEDAMREHRFADAVSTYDYMLQAFKQELPSLLDHAAVIHGKVVALQGLGDHSKATNVAESAVEILSVHVIRDYDEVAA